MTKQEPFEASANESVEQPGENPYLDENGKPYHDYPNEEEELQESL